VKTTPPADARFTRYPWWRRWFGLRSERAGAAFLRKLGFRVLARNVADRQGEIDLLAIDGKTLVIVEVRSTQSRDTRTVAMSIDYQKQRRLTNATMRFLKRRRLYDVPVRFDVLIISWPPEERRPAIQHYRNAFETTGRFQMRS
jgi:putative endonuclease